MPYSLAPMIRATLIIVAITHILTVGTSVFAQNAASPVRASPLSPEEISEGWIELFDGKTMFGWKSTSNADWRVSDGTLTASNGEHGLLRTTAQFSDFHLKLEFKPEATTNSGVFVRTSPAPKNLKTDCFEINIAPPRNPYSTGAVVTVQKPTGPVNVKTGQWNALEVIIKGDQLSVIVNGAVVNNVVATKQSPGRGFIGLQFRSGSIAFKNVFLKPLLLEPLFNRQDLEGWDDAQKMDSQFSVDSAGNLKVISGRGQLESKSLFADFVLQASCKTNAVGLNSGIFYRSIPGEFTNGYESQIQNQFKDGDPTVPVDCGTGGIFRRQDARVINARDQEWFTKTMIASGSHISVWVNGLQVTDWTDKRAPHPNPRKGLRLEAGSIILQGHDPTTDLLFGSIKAAELRPRR